MKFFLFLSAFYLFLSQAVAQTPATCNTIYAVHDEAVQDSQFFTYQLTQQTFQALGLLHQGYDIEALAVHPQTHLLYATSGQQNSILYNVDGLTGELTPIGNTGFDHVIGLAFHPTLHTLVGWSDQGLIDIDLQTGRGQLIFSGQPFENFPIQELTWNDEGTILYAAVNDMPQHSSLWAYHNQHWQMACQGLPKKVESLETRPDGLFIYSFHNDRQLRIHTLDIHTCQILNNLDINTPYHDIEDIAWSTCLFDHQDALRNYLESLTDVQDVFIENDGALSFKVKNSLYLGQLDNQIISGTPPVGGQLIMEAVEDINQDGIKDFQVIYPNGDKQFIYYFGLSEACQSIQPPPLDATVTTIPALANEFLYTGPQALQTGVMPGTIHLKQASILRGRVTTRQGQALPNVRITVKDVPQLGQTLTTCDGTFNLVVNGGSQLTLNYTKANFLPAQRKVNTAWQKYKVLDELVLVELDPQATTIQLGDPTSSQIAQGTVVADSDGVRQTSLYFPQNTQAKMVLPDGSSQALKQMIVRATEYTVGRQGPQTMPAPLPPSSGYTYAVELSVDEALQAGAVRVDFNQPVFLYVDNFLNFPVGGIVPIGWYDRTQSLWIPSENGKVIRLLEIEQTLAILDVEGHGQAATPAQLNALGITEMERTRLAQLYSPGQSFWRSPITHFTPWDCNWPYGLPANASYPTVKMDTTQTAMVCKQPGCLSETEKQVLSKSIPIGGTSLTLNYRSSRVVGYKPAYLLNIPLLNAQEAVPTSLKRIDLEIQLAGQKIHQSFPATQERTTFLWDGKDGLGRPVKGSQQVQIALGYVYDAVYYQPGQFAQSFAKSGQFDQMLGNRARQEITLWQKLSQYMRADIPQDSGLGGFSLSIHHIYDPISRTLYLGDGRRFGSLAKEIESIIETVVGNGLQGISQDGMPATQASFRALGDIVFDAEGNLYFVDKASSYGNSISDRIRKVNAQGILTTMVGANREISRGKLEGPATEVWLSGVSGLTFSPDKSFYFVDASNFLRRFYENSVHFVLPAHSLRVGINKVRRDQEGNLYLSALADYTGSDEMLSVYQREPHGTIIKRAGNGKGQFNGDGIPATTASMFPEDVQVAEDGSLYITDGGNNRVRHVDLKGLITTVTGDGRARSLGDGGPAKQASVWNPTSLAFGPEGELYIAETYGQRIRKISTDGTIITVAGDGQAGFKGDGESATAARMNLPKSLAFGPEGDLYFVDTRNYRIRRIKPIFPGFELKNLLITSPEGQWIYEFTPTGRHVRTLNALTGQPVYNFFYNSAGYLMEIKSMGQQLIRIIRDGKENQPIEILVPGGQKTSFILDENGYLKTVSPSLGETYQLQLDEQGLLKEFTDPSQHHSVYSYDELGLLK